VALMQGKLPFSAYHLNTNNVIKETIAKDVEVAHVVDQTNFPALPASHWNYGMKPCVCRLGLKHSLQNNPRKTPMFYWLYTILILFCASFIVMNDKILVSISVNIEVMNALILPLILCFVYKLAPLVLPEKHRLEGWYAILLASIFIVTSLFGLCAG
jgi:hypothetical protein